MLKPSARDPYANYLDSQLFDFSEHSSKGICQRCGSKKGPSITIDVDFKYKTDNVELTMPYPRWTKIHICKKCHSGLLQWLNIPTQDLF